VAEEYLTIPEVVAELRVPRSTFYYWRQLGRGPKALKLPNGDVRIRRRDLDSWLCDLEECMRCKHSARGLTCVGVLPSAC
jgi:predicted DNA-binding transcriptional regulator AlpA